MKTFQAYLPPGGRTYSCAHCRANLAIHDELISKVRLALMPTMLLADHSFLLSLTDGA